MFWFQIGKDSDCQYIIPEWCSHGWWTPFRRNGVCNDLCDWFASINATGSQWRKGWDQSSTEKRVNLTYHWFMHVIISSRNTIELCLIFRWDVPTKKRQIVTLEVKNITNNRKKSIISNFDENWRQWWACGCRHLSLQLFSIHPRH